MKMTAGRGLCYMAMAWLLLGPWAMLGVMIVYSFLLMGQGVAEQRGIVTMQAFDEAAERARWTDKDVAEMKARLHAKAEARDVIREVKVDFCDALANAMVNNTISEDDDDAEDKT